MTNDKLKYNSKTGRIDIISKAKDKDIKLISGTQLIRDLVANKNTLTINYSTIQVGSSAGPAETNPNHENGVGGNTVVTFSEVNPATQVAKNQDSRAENQDQPDFIVLGQEMSHAIAQMDGANIPVSRGTKMNTYTSSTGEKVTEWVPLEELTAHGIGSYGTRYSNTKRDKYPNENALRRENNLPVRVAYEIIPGQLKKRR